MGSPFHLTKDSTEDAASGDQTFSVILIWFGTIMKSYSLEEDGMGKSPVSYMYTVKKGLAVFSSGMSLTKLSLANNDLPSPSPRNFWSKQIQESRIYFLQCMFCLFNMSGMNKNMSCYNTLLL